LERIAAQPAVPPDELTVEAVRQALRNMLTSNATRTPVHTVEDLTIPGAAGQPMQARIYRPSASTPQGLLLYLHGGGWIAGDLAAYDPLCRELAVAGQCLVVAIEYRLAPEHKFPAAPLDCYAALGWLARNAATLGGDPRRLAVGGDSAGGNLAAVVAQLARDRHGPVLTFQLLVYPVTVNEFDSGSYREFAEGYLLTREAMISHWKQYLPNLAAGNLPMASPLRATTLAGLPPALIITAEYDPLRDEGETYGRRLGEAGVTVQLRRYEGELHAFFSLGQYFDQGRDAVREAGAALRRSFGQ